MPEFRDPILVRAILEDAGFIVPPVPEAPTGMAWLRSTVARFATGPSHTRRRTLAQSLIDTAAASASPAGPDHPVTVLARALGITTPITELVRDAAQAYRPGTGDEARADRAVDELVALLGSRDEHTAALIGVLLQACDATAVLKSRAATRPLDEVLNLNPPVPTTRRVATSATTIADHHIAAGETIVLALAGTLAFGAGPHRCPGRSLALTLATSAPANLAAHAPPSADPAT